MRVIPVIKVPRAILERLEKARAGLVQKKVWVKDGTGRKGHYRMQWVSPDNDTAGVGRGQMDLFSEPAPKTPDKPKPQDSDNWPLWKRADRSSDPEGEIAKEAFASIGASSSTRIFDLMKEVESHDVRFDEDLVMAKYKKLIADAGGIGKIREASKAKNKPAPEKPASDPFNPTREELQAQIDEAKATRDKMESKYGRKSDHYISWDDRVAELEDWMREDFGEDATPSKQEKPDAAGLDLQSIGKRVREINKGPWVNKPAAVVKIGGKEWNVTGSSVSFDENPKGTVQFLDLQSGYDIKRYPGDFGKEKIESVKYRDEKPEAPAGDSLFGDLPQQDKPKEAKGPETAPDHATVKTGLVFDYKGERKTIKLRTSAGGNRWIEVYGEKDSPGSPAYSVSWGKTSQLPSVGELKTYFKNSDEEPSPFGDLGAAKPEVKKSILDSFRDGLAKAFGTR